MYFEKDFQNDIDQSMRLITFVTNDNMASLNSKLSHLFKKTETKSIKMSLS